MSDLNGTTDGEAGVKPQAQPPPPQREPEPPPHEVSEESVYTYAAAGLRERKGRVPYWLWFVVIALAIWGVYYLMTYWNPPL
jgi:hypothetical protein